MQYHHDGYINGDPTFQPVSKAGANRPKDLPDVMDVLIVGEGPAGMITFAQLSQFPDLTVRLVEKRTGRLERGQADGLQPRAIETFQAFGFAKRLMEEAQILRHVALWQPDPQDPTKVSRHSVTPIGAKGLSEFPSLTVNQARIMQYFGEVAYRSPYRMAPDYGIEFVAHSTDESQEYPIEVTLRHVAGEREGEEFKVRTKYLVGADGAHSQVRRSIGAIRHGKPAMHAWGVIDMLCDSDFPDVRFMSIIQSPAGGSILCIPREGGQLLRLYVDLGKTEDNPDVRHTPKDVILAKANAMMHPYKVEHKYTAWWSVYEVAHRVTDRFDDVPVEEIGKRHPRVFILGDACHTHSAKAGQGMNVSMQDGFNLGWKLGQVASGVAPKTLLSTYTWERKVVAQNLIDFDTKWSGLMGGEGAPEELEQFMQKMFDFANGFMTEYQPSMITGTTRHQDLAKGYPIGRRFKSAEVECSSDADICHLGHLARADGKWKIYVFADRPKPNEDSHTKALAEWLVSDSASPFAGTAGGRKRADWVQAKVVYQQPKDQFEFLDAPVAFRPRYGKYDTMQYKHVFSALPEDDIFERREISRDGAIVVVRPDQYVAQVLPLTATDQLSAFFDGVLPRD